MTQHQARLVQGYAMAHHLGGGRVPQQVRPLSRRLNVGAPERVLHDGGDPVAGGKGPVRGNAPNEEAIGLNVGGPAFQVAQQGIADLLGQRQADLIAPFAHHLQRAAVPVDVLEPQPGHIAGA